MDVVELIRDDAGRALTSRRLIGGWPPHVSASEMVNAYREAARRDVAEAEALKRFATKRFS